jgi:hypothetical protein
VLGCAYRNLVAVNRYLDRLGRYARPLLLADAALLFGGIMLTSFNMLLIGWSIYIVGHVGLLLAVTALAAAYRRRMDGWAWLGLGVFFVGLLLALPQLADIWVSYSQTPSGAQMLLPAQTPPLGLSAELVTWIGLAWYGLAGRGEHALPTGVGWVFVTAAIVGALADWTIIAAYWWVAAILIMITGLVFAGGALPSHLDQSEAADAVREPSPA